MRETPVPAVNEPQPLPPTELDHEPCEHDFTDPPLCRKCGEELPGEPA